MGSKSGSLTFVICSSPQVLMWSSGEELGNVEGPLSSNGFSLNISCSACLNLPKFGGANLCITFVDSPELFQQHLLLNSHGIRTSDEFWIKSALEP